MKDIDHPPKMPKNRIFNEYGKEYFECDDCNQIKNYSFFEKIFKRGYCKCKQDYNHIDYVNHNPLPTGPIPSPPKGPPPPPQYSSHGTKSKSSNICHKFMKHCNTFEESKKSEVSCTGFLDLLEVIKGVYMQDHEESPFSETVNLTIIKLTNIDAPPTYSLILIDGKPFGYTYFG